MLEKLQYINHIGEAIQFGNNGLFVNKNDLHDFAWSVTSKNDRISAFRKGVVKKTIPVLIACNTEEEGIKARNRIFEVMEKDVLAMKHGKIIINGYYLKCFITGSKKKEYLKNKKVMQFSLSVQTDFPMWVKETTTTFNYGKGSQGTNLDFNNDFPYDYTSNLLGQSLNNTAFVPVEFRMNIYGPCINPKVTIAGHEYEVAKEFQANEYLTIDSREKTIILTHTDGTKENCFNLRNKESYIFEKIPVGVSQVSNNGAFKFDMVLLEERGEPKWI
jgi:hypothetical protein